MGDCKILTKIGIGVYLGQASMLSTAVCSAAVADDIGNNHFGLCLQFLWATDGGRKIYFTDLMFGTEIFR